MAKVKNNSISKSSSKSNQDLIKQIEKQNAKGKQILNKLIETLKSFRQEACNFAKNNDIASAIDCLKDLRKEYCVVMSDFSKFCKYPNDEVNQLKKSARSYYDKAGEIQQGLEAQQSLEAQQNLEAQQRQEVQREIREQKIEGSITTINKILNDLVEKINEQNPGGITLQAAEALRTDLLEARDSYQTNLDDNMSFEEANEIFKDAYTTAIENARPALEKDLSWGAYLGNLLKSLARALITVFTAGHVRPSSEVGMFAKSHSETFKAAKTAELELDSATRGGQLNSLN